jgi:hypothetical protein
MRHLWKRSGESKTRGIALGAMLIALAIAVLVPVLRQAARAADGTPPGQSNAFGDSLSDWQGLWLASYVGDADIPPDDNGNADIGHVVLLPIPAAAGDGTPASADVTLDAGQAFVVPLWSTYGFSYSDGTPNDPLVPISVFKTLELKLTIDGKTLIDGRNLMDYYSQTLFPNGLPLSFLPGDSIIEEQCIGLTHAPLSPGKHTMTLDAVNTEALPPQYGGGFAEYHNTWDITVKNGK